MLLVKTKADLKKHLALIHQIFAKKADLASLKLDVDELDIHNLKTVPVDLSKLRSVVNNDVVKKTVYDKVELDLSNCATKADLKKHLALIHQIFVKKADLASLKWDVDELGINKLKTVPVDLSKLSSVVNNVVKRTVYDKLVTKGNAIDTNKLVFKFNITLINFF